MCRPHISADRFLSSPGKSHMSEMGDKTNPGGGFQKSKDSIDRDNLKIIDTNVRDIIWKNRDCYERKM